MQMEPVAGSRVRRSMASAVFVTTRQTWCSPRRSSTITSKESIERSVDVSFRYFQWSSFQNIVGSRFLHEFGGGNRVGVGICNIKSDAPLSSPTLCWLGHRRHVGPEATPFRCPACPGVCLAQRLTVTVLVFYYLVQTCRTVNNQQKHRPSVAQGGDVGGAHDMNNHRAGWWRERRVTICGTRGNDFGSREGARAERSSASSTMHNLPAIISLCNHGASVCWGR